MTRSDISVFVVNQSAIARDGNHRIQRHVSPPFENPEEQIIMPAKSKAQQKAAGAALAAKRGDMPKSRLQGASKTMAKSMTEKELEDLASTKHKKLPEKKAG
ncbi:hypothetical protein GGQ73_002912 [Rhizobium skierniewicense]|uniref:DUF3008 family protein n=2 Tax=Rhizobium skierniewicense TaxID=984260 RepID=A0A7W6CAP6_9HYPH|nr:hypothetical protein [Rhizobium skierniewicense]